MATSHAADLAYRRGATPRRCGSPRRPTSATWGGEGETDRRTAASHHNVAVSLRLVGDFARAEVVDRDQLRRQRQLHGEEHLSTLLSVNALAEDLYGLGRYREALELPQPCPTCADGSTRTHQGVLLAGRTVALADRALGEPDRGAGKDAPQPLQQLHRDVRARPRVHAGRDDELRQLTLRHHGLAEEAHVLAAVAVQHLPAHVRRRQPVDAGLRGQPGRHSAGQERAQRGPSGRRGGPRRAARDAG